MNSSVFSQQYLQDLSIDSQAQGIELVRQIQSRHVTRYTFNNLSVVLQQEMPLETEFLLNKIVTQQRGGYCFEHNKLAFDVLVELGFEVRILMARVVYNRDVEVARTHRITLLTLDDQQYIVDVGFGHYGARFPVRLELGVAQEQGDNCYRIVQNDRGDYCFQIVKEGAFFTLYTFDLGNYNEADCLTGHFFSHKYPEAGFVNNLVVCRKFDDHTLSLRNGELHRLRQGGTDIEPITSAEMLHDKLIHTFGLDTDRAVAAYLYDKFAA